MQQCIDSNIYFPDNGSLTRGVEVSWRTVKEITDEALCAVLLFRQLTPFAIVAGIKVLTK